ncbi:MAG: ester cyclase [Rhodospirillaceae bacterium]|nr:ester cyclase [Rhodospirillaceae bacterium]
MGNEANLKTYLEMTDVLFNRRIGSEAGKYYADKFMSHNSDGGGSGIKTATVESMQEIWRNTSITYPDRVLTNDLILCAGDLVVARVTMTGTMTGPMMGMPPTGKAFSTSAIDIYRFKDGKVVERWGNNDGIGMLTQMGLLQTFAERMAAGVQPE